MASLSTPNLSSSPFIYRKIPQSSTKFILPAKCSTIRPCANISKILSSDYQVNSKKTSKATEIPGKSIAGIEPFSGRRRILFTTKCTLHTNEYPNSKLQSRENLIEKIRKRISNGKVEIPASAYDTAWVAMVPSSGEYSGIQQQPRFPECLEWIVKNQKADGSWGLDPGHPNLVKDSLSCTVASLLALRKWNMGHELVPRGLEFIAANCWAAVDQDDQFSPIGFNVIFPAMVNYAKELDLTLPLSSDLLDKLLHLRDSQLRKGKQEYIAEGFGNSCNWKDLISTHQRSNGSLFNSPATTAAALIHSPDHRCSQYLISLLASCNGSVPTIYPMDIWARLRVVDTLERLGIETYFEFELRSILDEIYRSWGEKDEEILSDVTSRAMAFRLLRMRGYDVSSDELAEFVDQEQFFNSVSMQYRGVSTVLELYRASQIRIYEDESTLEKIHSWTSAFLESQLLNRNILDKQLQKQVEYDLRCFHGTLDRFGHRRSIAQYDSQDLHIAKTAYRCPVVHNEDVIMLSVQDYRNSQEQYLNELREMQRWFEECRLDCLKQGRNALETSYCLSAAVLVDPKLSKVRISSAQVVVLATCFDDFFDIYGSKEEAFSILELVRKWDMQPTTTYCSREVEILFTALYNTANEVIKEASAEQGYCVKHDIVNAWDILLTNYAREKIYWSEDNNTPNLSEYLSFGWITIACHLFVLTSIHCYGIKFSEEMSTSEEYTSYREYASLVCRILNDIKSYKRESEEAAMNCISVQIAEGVSEEAAVLKAEQLVEYYTRKALEFMVNQTKGSILPRECKQLFWKLCKIAHCLYTKSGGDEFSSPKEFAKNMKELLWEPVQHPSLSDY